MDIVTGKKIYFASDQHLGAPDYLSSVAREKHFVKWLDEIKHDAAEIYLLGDLFDFWFEYHSVVPRGFTRVLGKISEITDAGIPVYFFMGNHDMWTFGYLEQECGMVVYDQPIERVINGKKFYIAHGDGLGPGDYGYKKIKLLFTHPFVQWCFARIHPNLGTGLANYLSRSSRSNTGTSDKIYLGDEKEWLVLHAKSILKSQYFDYFIFGHRHYPLQMDLTQGSQYINLGDWIVDFTFAVFDGDSIKLMHYGSPTE